MTEFGAPQGARFQRQVKNSESYVFIDIAASFVQNFVFCAGLGWKMTFSGKEWLSRGSVVRTKATFIAETRRNLSFRKQITKMSILTRLGFCQAKSEARLTILNSK